MDAETRHNPCHTEQEAVKAAAKNHALARNEYARVISSPDGPQAGESGVVDVAEAKAARDRLEAAEKELLRAKAALADCQVINGIG